MQKPEHRIVAIVAGLMFLGGHSAQLGSQAVTAADLDEKATHATDSASVTRFLIVGKGKIADHRELQQRGIVAVQKIAEAAKAARREAIVDALAEDVMTVEQYRRGQAKEMVTGLIFRERLRRLAEVATPQDTVVIYTHSHGRRNGFEESQPLGGIVMDLPVRSPEHGGTLLWDEYADLLLAIPAKNIVVLTMSCFSGGLVGYVNSHPVLDRWKDRRRKEGRNLIVLTSQTKNLTSPPIVKDGEVINPFTLAVAEALAWEADGFELMGGRAAKTGCKDGKLTVGELIDYVLYATENTISETPRRKNTAKPQLTGSFNRGDVLFERIEAPPSGTPNGTLQRARTSRAVEFDVTGFRKTSAPRNGRFGRSRGIVAIGSQMKDQQLRTSPSDTKDRSHPFPRTEVTLRPQAAEHEARLSR